MNEVGLITVGNKLTSLELQYKRETQEISQILLDEGFRLCVYEDTLGIETVGVGHRVLANESFRDCLSHSSVISLLRADYNKSKKAVERLYPWASGSVKLVLINLDFQMGTTGVSKFKNTIKALKEEKYDLAASELLNSKWAKQTPQRALRHASRILQLGGNY